MANSVIKLYYFNGRGRAELARLILAAAEKKYEDIRFPMEDWFTVYKPQAPFGQAPYMDVDGKRFAQSVALANFLAREFNYFGKDNLEALQIEQVQGLVKDVTDLWVDARFAYNDADPDEKLMEKMYKEHYPRFMGFFEKLLKENGSGYFVGSSVTMADFSVYDVCEEPLLKDPGLLKKSYPLLAKNRELVASLPGVAAYLKSRPVSPW